MTTETNNATTPAAKATPPLVEPRIYVASLADYNAGNLHGVWLKANLEPQEIHEEIQAMLRDSTEPCAEEWAIHDYEGFGGLTIDEYASIEAVHQIAKRITMHGTLYAALVSHLGSSADFAQADAAMDEQYLGVFDSLAHYAEESITDCFGGQLEALPGIVRWAIDWERVGQDLELSGDIFSIYDNHQIHVFTGQA